MQADLTVPFPQHPGIAHALAEHRLLVVVGPLVREAAGLPGLRALGEEGLARAECGEAARDEIRALLTSGSYAKAFEALKDRLGPLFGTVYEPLLAGPKVAPPESLRALATLAERLQLVLTTNLDDLVETTLPGPWVAIDEATADLASRTTTVFKMLGTAHRVSSWRFTADGLQNATYRAPHLRREVSALLHTHQLLLLGFRGDDELLAELVRLREHVPEDPNAPQWVALVPPGTSVVERAALGKRGVHLVALEVAPEDAVAYDRAVAGYLRHLAHAVPQVAEQAAVSEPQICGNPYPGLAPFVESQAGQFFGRRDDCAALVGKLGLRGGMHVRWLAVTGPSGVGKSSLLAAGLVPALRVGAPPVPGAPTRWVVAQVRPGREVLRNLAAAVRDALAHDLGVAVAPELLSRDMLAAQDRALADFLAARLQGWGLLLVLDQFEEAFTTGAAEDRPFLDALLVRSLQDVEVPFYLVTAVRSDCLGDLGRHFPRLAEQLNVGSLSARHDLQPLRPHELREAIERPAELAGRVFEPGLVDRILRDAGALHGESMAPDAALPLVAHVLHELHAHAVGRTLSLRAYESLGGVAESLTRSADALLTTLAGEYAPALVRGLLVELVELHPQGRDTRRVLPWAAAIAAAGGEASKDALVRAETLLRRLSGGASGLPGAGPTVRLIATRGEGEQAVVDLVHDALLREWTTLRGWLQEDREVGLLRQELAHAAEGWAERGRPDDELWRGGRLVHASEALQARPLLPDVQAFLVASTARAQAETAARAAEQAEKLRVARRNNRRLLGLGGVLLVVAIVALFEYRRADAAATLAGQRLTTANIVVNQILFEVLPALDKVPGTAKVSKHIHALLVEVQTTLLQDAKDDRRTLRLRMVQHHRRGDLALTHDDLAVARQEFEAGNRLAEQLAQDAADSNAQHDLSVSLERLGDVEVSAGNLTAARAHFDRSLSIVEKMVEQDPDNAVLRRGLAVSFDRLGGVEVSAGNLTAARAHFVRSLSIVEKMVEQDPDNAALRRDLSAPLSKLGDVEVSAGNLTAARAHFDRSLSLREKMVEQDPDNAALRRDLSASLLKLGDVEVSAGNLTAARAHFDRSLSIVEKMVEQDPDNAALRRDLSVSLERLGDVEVIAGNLTAARAHFDRSLSLREKMVEQDPDNAALRHDLSVPLDRLGAVEVSAGNLTAARAHFDRSLSLREKMVEQDPDNAVLRRGIAVSLDRLGDVEKRAGNLTAARAHFDRSLSIVEKMVEQDPDNAALRSDLSASLLKLGDVEVSAGNLTAARAHFDRSLSIDEKMVEQDPDNAALRRDLSVSLERLGAVEVSAGNLTAARAHFDRSLSLRERMVEQDPDNAALRRDLSVSLSKLGDVEVSAGNLTAARAHFDRSLSIDKKMVGQDPDNAALRRDLSISLDRLGDVEKRGGNLTAARAHFDRSLSIVEKMVEQDPDNAALRFDLVLAHMKLVFLTAENDDATALREHLTVADTILDEMGARGQLKGFAQREAIRAAVDDLLSSLPG